MVQGYSPVDGGGKQRTEMNCHNCSKNFVAELDFDISGDHIIECPHCGHEHWRTIKDGKITNHRWGADKDNGGHATRVKGTSVWKSSVIQAKTSSVSHFLRERWLNRSDFNST